MQPETEVDLHCELWKKRAEAQLSEGLNKYSPTQNLTVYVDLATFLALKRPVIRFTAPNVPSFHLSFHIRCTGLSQWCSCDARLSSFVPLTSPLSLLCFESTRLPPLQSIVSTAARDSAQAEVCAALLAALLFFKQFYFLVCEPLGGMKRKLTVQKHFFFTAATGTVWRQTYRHSDTWRWYWPRARPPCIPIIPVRL